VAEANTFGLRTRFVNYHRQSFSLKDCWFSFANKKWKFWEWNRSEPLL